MADVILTVQVLPAPDDEPEDLLSAAGGLLAELRRTDATRVAPMRGEDAPEGAKGPGAVIGWLVARVPGSGVLQAFVQAIADWARRSNRTVYVTIDGDTLKVLAATPEQQNAIIEAWLKSHGAGE